MTEGRTAEHGFTLVELLLAIALMGILFVGVFAGLTTFFTVTISQRANADLDAVVRAYVEQVSDPAETPYDFGCPASYSFALPSGYSFTAGPTVEYWNGDNPATFSTDCGADNPNGLQRVTATIRHALPNKAGHDAEVVFVKRNVA